MKLPCWCPRRRSKPNRTGLSPPYERRGERRRCDRLRGMKKPMRIAITGAAGQISYQLCFRIAAGDMLGADQPVVLQLVEIPPALDALRGVVMELTDCAFPLLAGTLATTDPAAGFEGVDVALLVGARPRGPGMERKDLLSANGQIFGPQGRAIAQHASPDVRVLVVG